MSWKAGIKVGKVQPVFFIVLANIMATVLRDYDMGCALVKNAIEEALAEEHCFGKVVCMRLRAHQIAKFIPVEPTVLIGCVSFTRFA